ncbi:MAG: toprim domain-containing protein [Gammaproteobacteria bacterium]
MEAANKNAVGRRRGITVNNLRLPPSGKRLREHPAAGWRPANASLWFREAMAEAGLETHADIIPDGRLHRFSVEGDRPRSHNGWYVLHMNGVPAGVFGSWKSGVSQNWCAKSQESLTPVERSAFKARMEVARRRKKEEQEATHTKARQRALSIWRIAQPVELHPYLAKKRIKSHGIRQYKGCLVIPLRDTAGAIHSLQFIDREGNKRFLFGGAIRGHYHAIGYHRGTLCIAEGYATGAAIHQATGHAVAVAFNAANLKPVAIHLRDKFPDVKIILCADNDRFTPGNPGVAKAREAALAVGGLLLVPRFSDVGPFDYYREGERHG